MTTVLIDIGNSRIKWACLIDGKLQPMATIGHRQSGFARTLQANWSALPTPDKIALASVGQPQLVDSIMALSKQLWPNCEFCIAQTTAEQCGVKNGYRIPEKLGIDRWLALIAAYHHYRTDCWVIDCGSAITLDFIRQNGQHLGGLIAPGINMMQRALAQNTAHLPVIKPTSVNNLADFTEAAIYSGTLLAACGLIEKAVSDEYRGQLLLTGGDAPIIAGQLRTSAQVDPELVLKGLAIYSQSEC